MPSDPALAAELGLGQRPKEDAGATTIGYYEYQYGCVASLALEMMDPSSGLEWIVCEWFTDIILGWETSFAPVSVKHREANSGRWTVSTLFSDGGLRTLYMRWQTLGRPRECRWMTNGGFDSECVGLAKACSSGNRGRLNTFVTTHGWRFEGPSDAEIMAFLCSLRLIYDNPRAADQRIVAIEQACKPALRRVGLSIGAAANAYDAVVALARDASTSFGAAEPSTWTAAAPGAFDVGALTAAEVESRLIRRSRIEYCLRQVAEPAAAELPQFGSEATTLIKKLRRGNVVPTAEALALRTRVSWSAYESAYTDPIPDASDSSEFVRLRALVLDAALDAQLSAEESGSPYGNQMLRLLRPSLRTIADGVPTVTPVLLMGLVFDLTARCEVWWSPWFDVEGESAAVEST